jgi:hypothetical protein
VYSYLSDIFLNYKIIFCLDMMKYDLLYVYVVQESGLLDSEKRVVDSTLKTI